MVSTCLLLKLLLTVTYVWYTRQQCVTVNSNWQCAYYNTSKYCIVEHKEVILLTAGFILCLLIVWWLDVLTLHSNKNLTILLS
jgi:hypothetical protein